MSSASMTGPVVFGDDSDDDDVEEDISGEKDEGSSREKEEERIKDEEYSSGEEESEEERDDGEGFNNRDEWLGKIKWESESNPFSAPGDSGALVYAFEKGTVIPLGVHLGSPTSWPLHSVCLNIETYCLEGKKAGYGRLRFAGAESQSRTVEAPASNTSEEEEELTEEELQENNQVEREYMEAFFRAKGFSSQETSDDETCM
ncbi:hypothetical protein MMC31_008213 [Peltigera leucophlebia]|nr:hypothetical protein [Peltigera leucophlebia]